MTRRRTLFHFMGAGAGTAAATAGRLGFTRSPSHVPDVEMSLRVDRREARMLPGAAAPD